jgi:hypothetical protein
VQRLPRSSPSQLRRHENAAFLQIENRNKNVPARCCSANHSLLLPDRTGGGRKHVVCTATNQSDRAHYQYQNDGQHNRILSDVLAFFLQPELAKPVRRDRTSLQLLGIVYLASRSGKESVTVALCNEHKRGWQLQLDVFLRKAHVGSQYC